jgi:hypothetical protein
MSRESAKNVNQTAISTKYAPCTPNSQKAVFETKMSPILGTLKYGTLQKFILPPRTEKSRQRALDGSEEQL